MARPASSASTILVMASAALLFRPTPLAGDDQATPSGDRRLAAHVLNRLTFGPRPGDLEKVAAMGVRAFIERQLHPERIALGSASWITAALPSAFQSVSVLFRPGRLLENAPDTSKNHFSPRSS